MQSLLDGVTLLLTASVKPNVVAGLTRADPAVRERDYLAALRWLLERPDGVKRVVLVENSGWPLEAFRQVAAECRRSWPAVEFIGLNTNDFPPHLGRGYGELLMMDEALVQSKLVRDGTHIAKLTGRLRLLNMGRILRAAGADLDVLCDLRDHQLYRRLHLPASSQRCDSRFFVFRQAWYDQCLRGRYRDCDDSRGVYFEHVLFDAVKRSMGAWRVGPRFATEPRYAGVAGHGGINYGSAKQRLRWGLRWLARRLVPWVYW